MQPSVTHHRPPNVFGNDPLVQLGEGGQSGTRDGLCARPSAACIQCPTAQNQHMEPDGPTGSEQRFGGGKRQGDEQGASTKVSGLWAGVLRGDHHPSSGQNTPLCCEQRGALSTLPLLACYCFSKTSALDVAWGQTEKRYLCPLHLSAGSCSTTAIKARLMDLMLVFSRDSLLENPGLLNTIVMGASHLEQLLRTRFHIRTGRGGVIGTYLLKVQILSV